MQHDARYAVGHRHVFTVSLRVFTTGDRAISPSWLCVADRPPSAMQEPAPVAHCADFDTASQLGGSWILSAKPESVWFTDTSHVIVRTSCLGSL
jgi:hypothetical protein